MSHVVSISLEIKDLDALARACESLGLKLNLGQESYRWYGTHIGDYPIPVGFTVDDLGKCSHAITLPGSNAYEIGVVSRDGHYTLLWDFYGRQGKQMADKVGYDGQNLVDAYSRELTISHLQSEGYAVSTWTNEFGETIVEAVQ